ncbi:hypothetical protein [Mongoliibacter ruber]|uniref:GyrI-like small molecule binding protein n=1 Tax=Mongoliibacter ruber TaxID=1750599 RepID=A0A2T0WQF6_9BACT|nr:hypothetical protein [Mongoliibacter ruber]PRY88926.1 hypothetical protein CLW00_10346 [Mongoliibacter ruber]
MKKKPLISLIVLLALVAVIGLYMFGGFNDIEVAHEDLGEIELAGIYYRGTPQDPELKRAFEKIEGMANDKPEAYLNTIYYIEPAGKLDTMEVFVGLEKKWTEGISGLTEKTFDGTSAIVANIQSHRFVMPGPKKVQSKIRQYAEENSLSIPDVYIDQIFSPSKVRVVGLKK